MLWRRLRREKQERTGFSSNLEFLIGLALCLLLIAIGLPLKPGSPLGWIVSILGVAGILALIIISIHNQWGTRPSYDEFLVGAFFFFTFSGLTAGLVVADTVGRWLGAVGMILGYLVGIAAGLFFQYFGWFSKILEVLFWLAVVLLMSADLVLLTR